MGFVYLAHAAMAAREAGDVFPPCRDGREALSPVLGGMVWCLRDGGAWPRRVYAHFENRDEVVSEALGSCRVGCTAFCRVLARLSQSS